MAPSTLDHCSIPASLDTYFFLFFFFHLTYSRWTSSLPSCLWSQRIFPSLPGSRLTIFLSRCKFSTLTTRQPMVEFYLLTFPRFPLRKKEHKFYFGKNRTHDFRTSMCAGYLLNRPLGRRVGSVILAIRGRRRFSFCRVHAFIVSSSVSGSTAYPTTNCNRFATSLVFCR